MPGFPSVAGACDRLWAGIPRRRLPRFVLVSLLVAPLFAADTIQEQLQDFANSLQSGNASAAISFLDPQAKDFGEIRRAIEGIIGLPNTECAIDPGQVNTQGNQARLETQWTLRLSPLENGPLLVRSEKVSMEMRRNGEEWKIISLAPMSILARPTSAIFDAIAKLASNLSAGDFPGALSAFDSSVHNYGQISNDIDALTTQADVLCAIDVVADNENDGTHKVDTDWYLEIKPKADGAGAQRRRQRVSLRMESKRGKWKITAIDPASIVSPPG